MMLLRPNKTKFNKTQRGRFSRICSSFNIPKNGRIALIAKESGIITANQIESTRQVINRYLRRKGKIWINLFPHIPMTSKPTEVRMGKGKGAVKVWVCRIKAGKILFEIAGVDDQRLLEALNAARKKLSLRTFVYMNSWKINKKV